MSADSDRADAPGRLKRLAPVLAGLTALTCLLGWLQKQPCASVRFDFLKTTANACYTDVYPSTTCAGSATASSRTSTRSPVPTSATSSTRC
ncbi:hypothetical protein ACFQY7_39485 [Actinomadura luteofluorescens]|uniref:hypothetical protein n=1 Tax=Actinomadura luteofluorescens TaxID=46163 RepID=UPI0036397D94